MKNERRRGCFGRSLLDAAATLARLQPRRPNTGWASRMSEEQKNRTNPRSGMEISPHLLASRTKNQNRKWSSQIQNDKTKNETTSDFSTKIQHDSYTAEVTALPPSF
jgi:hypothetical protein